MNIERLLGWVNGFCESETNNEKQARSTTAPCKPQGCGTQIRPSGLSLRHPPVLGLERFLKCRTVGREGGYLEWVGSCLVRCVGVRGENNSKTQVQTPNLGHPSCIEKECKTGKN